MYLLHTKLPVFIQKLKYAALRHEKTIPCDVLGLENLTSAKVQSARTGRLEREIDELSQLEGTERIEVQILPRVPETLHTVVLKAYDEKGEAIKVILDTVGILHPGVDCYIGNCKDVDDRRPAIGKH